MDSLNIEILPYIFLNLPLSDIFTCKLVCKKWLFALRHWVKIRELVVFVEEQPVNSKWADEKNIDCLHSLRLASDRYMSRRNTRLNFEEALFSNLKRLYIERRAPIEDHSKCIEGLNKFRTLEELALPTIQLYKDTRLSLPHLKRLTTEKMFGWRFKLYLDTPRMEWLQVFSNKRIRFESTNLRHMKAFHFYPSSAITDSLRYLFCYYLHELTDDFLATHQLEELHLYAESATFASLKNQKLELIRKDVRIFFKGLQIDGLHDKMEDLLFRELLNDKFLNYYLRNYDKLATQLPYLYIVNYDPFDQLQVPLDFLGRFVELEKVVLSKKLANEKPFIEFLKCIRVESLKVSEAALTQEFYSVKLPAICPNLQSLKIVDPLIDQLNLDFIFQLQNLFDFCTNKTLEIEFVRRAFEELIYFRYVSFNYQGEKMTINNLYRNDQYEFRLKLADVTKRARIFRTFEELTLELNGELKNISDDPTAAVVQLGSDALNDVLENPPENALMAEDIDLMSFMNADDDISFHILDDQDETVQEMLQLGIDRREDVEELERELQDFESMNPDGEDESLDEAEADPDFYHFFNL